jgi:hypothetical protein
VTGGRLGRSHACAPSGCSALSLLADDDGAVGVAEDVGRDARRADELLEAPELTPAEDDHVGLMVAGEGEQAITWVAVDDVEGCRPMGEAILPSAEPSQPRQRRRAARTDVDALGDKGVGLRAQVLEGVGAVVVQKAISQGAFIG